MYKDKEDYMAMCIELLSTELDRLQKEFNRVVSDKDKEISDLKATINIQRKQALGEDND